MTAGQKYFDRHYKIYAGKFRRYHGESWLKRIFDIKTNLWNLRDVVFVLIGTVQSFLLLRKIQPDVILLKGGYVGVPVALAAPKSWPLVTHDSDALPGLANRLVGQRAIVHATAMPAQNYKYPPESIREIGVIIGPDFSLVNQRQQQRYKQQIGEPADCLLLTITGGSLGSKVINQSVAQILPELLEQEPNLHVIHQVGRGNLDTYEDYDNQRLKVMELLPGLAPYLGASDVVVSRAGATTIAELGAQGKASIIIPNPLLTGGHQLKNADYLVDNQAAVLVSEEDLESQQGRVLAKAIVDLLASQKRRHQLGQNLHKITKLDAAEKLAKILLDVAKKDSGKEG